MIKKKIKKKRTFFFYLSTLLWDKKKRFCVNDAIGRNKQKLSIKK
jgi:hypothetical protein